MLMKFYAILVWLLAVCTAQGQKHLTALQTKLRNADSVIIVSHDNTNAYLTDKATGKRIPSPKLVMNGSPNETIIRKRKLLADTAVKRLAEIFVRSNGSGIVEMGKCFMPHNAVLIYAKQRLSYLDICFDCDRLIASKDIAINEADFDSRKWREFYEFFLQNGLESESDFKGSSPDK